jgi:hypothetical protein
MGEIRVKVKLTNAVDEELSRAGRLDACLTSGIGPERSS